MRDVFKQQPTVALTFDGWTSGSGASVLGVVAHYVDENFNMQQLCVAADEMTGAFCCARFR